MKLNKNIYFTLLILIISSITSEKPKNPEKNKEISSLLSNFILPNQSEINSLHLKYKHCKELKPLLVSDDKSTFLFICDKTFMFSTLLESSSKEVRIDDSIEENKIYLNKLIDRYEELMSDETDQNN